MNPNPGAPEQLIFVQKKVDEQIKYFTDKRARNKRMTIMFVVASASLSTVATVAIGVSKYLEITWLSIIALIASGLSTIVAACEALLSFRQQWTINNMALVPLWELQRCIAFRTLETRAVEQDEVNNFFAQFNKITGTAYNAWATLHSKGIDLANK
jgi:hypothetical protein